jgi:inorganic triphosphatase YgiF
MMNCPLGVYFLLLLMMQRVRSELEIFNEIVRKLESEKRKEIYEKKSEILQRNQMRKCFYASHIKTVEKKIVSFLIRSRHSVQSKLVHQSQNFERKNHRKQGRSEFSGNLSQV